MNKYTYTVDRNGVIGHMEIVGAPWAAVGDTISYNGGVEAIAVQVVAHDPVVMDEVNLFPKDSWAPPRPRHWLTGQELQP